MNKHIRAAFFDIDGTLLLFGSHEMPDSTVQALHALQANGVKVFIATGRPPVHLPHLPALQKVNWDGYVTMNGQYCFMADGEVIYSKYIDPAALRTLLPYIEKEKLSIGFVEKDNCYFNLINEHSANFAKEPLVTAETTSPCWNMPVSAWPWEMPVTTPKPPPTM